jgi:hypothetical protein
VKTSLLISRLSADLKPQKQAISDLKFLSYATSLMFLIFSMALFVLPIRRDFAVQMGDVRFYFESLLWILLALSSAVVAYRSALLPSSIRQLSTYVRVSFIALLLVIVFREDFLNIKNEFFGEFVLKRGGCGIGILAITTLCSIGFCFWMRQLYPTNMKLTMFWSGLSGGFVAISVMQFSCFHSNPMHVFLWHFSPVVVTAIAVSFVSAKFLKR